MSGSLQLGFAALVAAIAAVSIPICTGLWYVFGPPILDADGSPDNAPIRSVGLLLHASPVVLLLLVGYFAIVPVVTGRRTLGALVAFNLMPSFGLALLAAVQGSRAFGLVDGAISFAVIWFLSSAFLTVGSVAWSLAAPSAASMRYAQSPAA